MKLKFFNLGMVVFYKMNKNHTMTEIGRTSIMDSFDALNVFANTPNPESQMIEGSSVEEIQQKYNRLSINVKNPRFVEETILPCL